MSQGDQFFESMADAIFERLQKIKTIRKRVFDLEQAAEYLSLSEDAVRGLVAQGRLTPTRPTRKVQFDVFDLDKLVEEGKQNAA